MAIQKTRLMLGVILSSLMILSIEKKQEARIAEIEMFAVACGAEVPLDASIMQEVDVAIDITEERLNGYGWKRTAKNRIDATEIVVVAHAQNIKRSRRN